MKQLHYYRHWRWSIGLLLTGFLSGCSDDMQLFSPVAEDNGLRLELQATIDQVNDTRADESGFADGDKFGVFVVNYKDNQPGTLTISDNQANNVAFSYNAEANKWSAATDIYWRDADTPADIYGYYPFHNGLSDVGSYRFEVQSDQSVAGSDGDMGNYEVSDFLWAKSSRATPGKKVELTFNHIMAGVKVTLQKGSGFEGDAWEKLPRTVTVDNTLRTANINLSNGVATPSGHFDRNVVMNPESGDIYRAVVVPQAVAAGKSIIGITIDGVTYNFNRDGGMEYVSGKLHTFTIKVDQKAEAGKYTLTLVNEDIIPWEADNTSHDFEANSYIVVNVAEAGTLKSCLEAMNCDLTTLKNLKITGQLTEEDFRVMREEMPQLASLHIGNAKMVRVGYHVETEGTEWWWDWPVEYMDDIIPENALSHHESIRRIILPQGIKRIGPNAFPNTRLTSTLIIPESVKRIDDWAFSCIGDEATIIMPSSLEYIGSCAFYGLGATMELKLSNTIRHIGVSAFRFAGGVTGTFNVPNKLEYLGTSAFEGCGHDLTGDIIIPVSIKIIPELAFAAMQFINGTTLSLHQGIQKIDNNAFTGLKFTKPFLFPDNLKEIGIAAFKYCHFTGSPKLPKNINYLAPSAFSDTNYNGEIEYPKSLDMVQTGINELVGAGDDFGGAFIHSDISSVILGDNILQVGIAAFAGCEKLTSVYIGKNVNFIGERAFARTPALSTFVCLAKEPPTVYDDTFTEIYFDKAILEVPEESVELYRSSKGWNKFQNITPHRELAFNIPDIACLDKGITREGILRAEGAWSVECPEWVHVSPDHGDYKDEITVTVSPLPTGSNSREGVIKFKLVGKNYTTYTTVRQLSYDKAEDTEIILQSASAGAQEIPVFIVGEGFNADDIVSGEYMRRMNETKEQLFSIEPYKSYQNYFTVTTSVACSPDKGTGDVLTTKINCFDTDGVQPDRYKLQQYVEKVSQHAGKNMSNALIIMVSNYNSFSGWSDIDWSGCGIAGIGCIDDVYPYDQRGLVQHFAGGEAFAGLGNEMVTHFEHIKGCSCPCCNALGKFNDMKGRGYYQNLTMSSKMSDAPWKDFIFHPKYSAIVDMWEGGYDHLRGVWRSEANSVMNTYISYFNTISRYSIYKEIMRRAGRQASLQDFIDNDKIEIPK